MSSPKNDFAYVRGHRKLSECSVICDHVCIKLYATEYQDKPNFKFVVQACTTQPMRSDT
jgi:hypothetical protein